MTTQHPPPRRVHLLAAALAWTVFVIYGSLVPLRFNSVDLSTAIDHFKHLPPLNFAVGTRSDWGSNVALFVPLTILWMGAIACDRGSFARLVAALCMAPLAMAASLAIEFLQIFFLDRTVSRNDIAAETFGGLVGIALWLGAGQQFVEWCREAFVDRRPRSQVRWLLQAYLLGFTVFTVMPLDLTISPAELYDKYRLGQIQLMPFAYSYESLSTLVYQFFADIVLFVPAGAYVAMGGRQGALPGVRLRRGIIGGALFAAAIEFTQLLVLSRYTDVTDVILGTVGAAIGAWLVVRNDASGPEVEATASNRSGTLRGGGLWLALVAGYSLFLLVGFWFPFDVKVNRDVVAPRLEQFFQVPFTALYWGHPLNALRQMLLRVLLFAPLGVIWAGLAGRANSSALRRVILVAGFGYAVGLAFGIELGQVFMPDKIADFTEVILCSLGALGGLIIGVRLRRVRPR